MALLKLAREGLLSTRLINKMPVLYNYTDILLHAEKYGTVHTDLIDQGYLRRIDSVRKTSGYDCTDFYVKDKQRLIDNFKTFQAHKFHSNKEWLYVPGSMLALGVCVPPLILYDSYLPFMGCSMTCSLIAMGIIRKYDKDMDKLNELCRQLENLELDWTYDKERHEMAIQYQRQTLDSMPPYERIQSSSCD
jgi:hypothetical protein